MALKITTQIGTDKGITSEAYVRISEYNVAKSGLANFKIELFQTENDKISFGETPVYTGYSRNQEIGEYLHVSLTKEVDAVRTVKKSVEVSIEATETVAAHTEWQVQDVEEPYKKTVPDLSPLEQGTIFEFGYAKLKEKLVGLFGEEHVIDC